MEILTCFAVACFVSTFMTSCHISASPHIKPKLDFENGKGPLHLTKPAPNAAQVHSSNLQNALVGVVESHFDEKLMHLKNEIRSELNNERISVLKEIKSFDKNLGDLKNELVELKDRMDKQTKTVQLQDEVLKTEDEKIDQLSECTSPKVAFTATLTKGGNLLGEKDVTIKYENVLLNESGDYNQETGIFTAKEPGLYLFTLHVTGKFESWADLYIAHNDQKVTAAFATGFTQNRNAASTDATLQLKVGDTVQVKSLVGKHDRKLTDLDGTFNSFSGVLIKSDKCNALEKVHAVTMDLP